MSHVKEIRKKKAPTWLEDGYTGDLYCKKCGVLLRKGSVLPKKWDAVKLERISSTIIDHGEIQISGRKEDARFRPTRSDF